MIVSMPELLAHARRGKYAVGCFNSIDLAMTRGILRAAQDEKKPVILCHAQVHFKYTPLESVMPIICHEAQKADVPVALLLDHGKDFDALVQSMHLGMNAVMYDGSELPYGENVANTRQIVRIARALGVAVEGELGRVVRPTDAGADGTDDSSLVSDDSLYTDPEQAAQYVEATGIDALACAFGTVHGVYRQEPRLDFERLERIARLTGVPIVMHGGSGLNRGDFRRAIDCGVAKINYYTNMALYVGREVQKRIAEQQEPFYHQMMVWAQQAVYEDARQAIGLFSND